MSLEQNDPKPNDGIAGNNSNPSREEVNAFLDSFDEEKAEKRIDVLEDMLDIMNER